MSWFKASDIWIFIHRRTKKWQGIMLYPPNCLSVHTSVCPSALHFRVPTLVSWPIFFKLCIGIDIGEEWYGIANGLILFRNNRVMALDLCKKCVFPQYLQNNWMNFDKILHMHRCISDLGLDNYILFFINFQQSYGPGLTSEFCSCLIDGFLSNFVHALVWIVCR